MGSLNIKITDDNPNAIVSTRDKDNLEKFKSVPIDELISGLISDHKLSTGLLPNGTRLFSGGGNNYNIHIEMPAKIRDMKIFRLNSDGSKKIHETIQIPYPTCTFSFCVIDKKIHDIRIFSTKHPIQSESDTMFMFPFSNVYADGRVCWGGVKLPGIKTPMELIDVINMFLSSDFNGDLVGTNFVTPKDYNIVDFWTFIKYVQGKKEFPSEILRATGMNFKRIITMNE